MASITRSNPTAVARGTIQRNQAQTVYKAVLSGSGLAVAASDAAAAKISDALGSVCSIVQFKSNGNEVFMVADRHSTNIGAIAALIADVLETSQTAEATVSGGTATLSDTETVIVTEPTDLEGM